MARYSQYQYVKKEKWEDLKNGKQYKNQCWLRRSTLWASPTDLGFSLNIIILYVGL